MHGLSNRAIECFVRDIYGVRTWDVIVFGAGLDFDSFESMLRYDDALTHAVLDAASEVLGKPRDVILEDVGTYLVSHPSAQAVRRLLRFGGVTFGDFLISLEELPGRARLAVPDLDLPQLELVEHDEGQATLYCRSGMPGYGFVLVGVLRAIADDYGALVLLDHLGETHGVETIAIQISEAAFSEGRSFALAPELEAG